MTDRLTDMLARQRALQEETYGADPASLLAEERVQFIKDMTLALTDELHEALQEVGWKPWATSRHVNAEAFKDELVDAWHFFMNLMLVSGMTADDLHARYLVKREKNIARQVAGYDGVSDKCPRCHRAIDDTNVHCRPEAVGEIAWCELYGAYVSG